MEGVDESSLKIAVKIVLAIIFVFQLILSLEHCRKNSMENAREDNQLLYKSG